MFPVIGLVVLLVMIFGGFAITGGALGPVMEAIPHEMLIIGGAAAGALIIGDSMKELGGSFKKIFKGPKYAKQDYLDTIFLVSKLMKMLRTDGLIAVSIKDTANPIMIRGHTDSLGYGDPLAMNNWMLSSGRAEATRRRLAAGNIPEDRFNRIEGVADREPMIEDNKMDPRNRRVAITLLYRAGAFGQ
jgi:hypothetical protein